MTNVSYAKYTILKSKSDSKGPNNFGNATQSSLFCFIDLAKYKCLETKDKICSISPMITINFPTMNEVARAA